MTSSSSPDMPDVVWNDRFLLGYGPMDNVHHEFVDIVGAMLRGTDDEFLAHLQAFERHAKAHFGDERQWMESTGFPAADCHIDEHEKVLHSLTQVLPLVAAGNVAVGRSFAQALIDWFPGHADYMDSALAQWMVKRQHGGTPVVVRRHAASGAAPTRT